ncbi:MAG: putative glycoside hydrolase [Thermodesulfobacteriota bacterium]|nr:putative glycoside hydrolase [Thermodesulfobacteriota bacterium]
MKTGPIVIFKSKRLTSLFIIIVLTFIANIKHQSAHPQPLSLLPSGGEVRNGQAFHTTKRGQSLYLIASKYLPLTDSYTQSGLVKELIRINSLKKTLLPIGKELRIPVIHNGNVVAKTVSKNNDFEAKGIYITGISAGTERIIRLASELKRLGGNTIVFDAKDMSGLIFYKSKVKLAKQIGASEKTSIRDLNRMVYLLHKNDIHVVARIVLFHDELLAEKRPDLAVRSRSTGNPWRVKGKVAWVDPSMREVQKYNLDLAKELASFGVDEIQFDYIRFPAMGDTDDAMYQFDETKTPKRKIITDFLKRAYKKLKPLKVLVSIDVYGISVWDKEIDVNITGQKIQDLARYTDIISPMLYPSHFSSYFGNKPIPADEPYYFVYNGCKKMAELTKGTEVKIRPWLQAFPLGITHFGKDYILKEIAAAEDAATTGWLLWDAENSYKVALEALGSTNE